MAIKKNDVVLQEEATTENLEGTSSVDKVKISYEGDNLSFTINKDRFTKGTIKLLDSEMATIALKNNGFKKVE